MFLTGFTSRLCNHILPQVQLVVYSQHDIAIDIGVTVILCVLFAGTFRRHDDRPHGWLHHLHLSLHQQENCRLREI